MTMRIIAFCSLLLATAPAALAESLLVPLVPADAGLCVEFDNVGQQAADLLEGELFRRLGQFPPLARWHADLEVNLPRMARQVERQLGLPSAELRRRLLTGESLVAVWPMTEAAGPSPVLLMFQTEDAGQLRQALDAVCDAQDRAGVVVGSRTFSHAGTDYRVRSIRQNTTTTMVCLAQIERIGILASDEKIVREVLDRHAAGAVSAGGLADLPVYRESMARLSPRARMRAFVNPRVWDDAVDRRLFAHGVRPDSNQLDRPLRAAWRATRYWVASFDSLPRPTAESFLAFDPAALPARLRELLSSASGHARFAERLPADSLIAAAACIDLNRLAAALRPAAVDAPSGGLGDVLSLANLLAQSLGGLGPEWGASLVPAAGTVDEFPFAWTAGVAAAPSRRADGGGLTPEERQAGLRSALTLALPRDVDPPPTLRTIELQDRSVFAWPRPNGQGEVFASFNSSGTVLWAASSADLLSRNDADPPERTLAQRPEFAELLPPRIATPSLVLFADGAALRRLVSRNRAALVRSLTDDKGVTTIRAERGVSQFLSLTRLADACLVAASIDESGISVSVSASYRLTDGSAP
jgi:hypothetical protein